MILYLVRHGQTAHNRDGVGLGRDDIPLTELGEQQAAALGTLFAQRPLDRVICSPLRRASETAVALAGKSAVPLDVDPALTEMDVGATEGLSFAEMDVRFPEFLAAWRGDHPEDVDMPGGESLRDVATRLEPLVARLRRGGPGTLVVVSHNFVLKVLLCELLGLPLNQFRVFTIDVASLSTITIERGRLNIKALNDCCHLLGLEP